MNNFLLVRQVLRPALTFVAVSSLLGLNTWVTLLGAQARVMVMDGIQPGTRAPHAAAQTTPLLVEGETPYVTEAVTPTLSMAVRDLPTELMVYLPNHEAPERQRPSWAALAENITNVPDPLAGRVIEETNTPSPLFTVDGVNNLCNCSPPDTVGDVGPNHYVQMVNATTFSIFNKAGTALVSNVALNTLWASGGCATSANGDPIVVYDALADRWLLAQFSTGNGICVAVSQTADPTGAYFGYEFSFPSFPDYFKISAWPDAYYVSANENDYSVAALDRTRMLAGLSASMIRFAPAGLTNLAMPADVDGPTAPPANAPGYFYTFKDNSFHGGADRLEVYEFRPNWVTPANSTFVLTATLPIADYTYTVCGFFVLSCIPQGGTTRKVDPVSEWPMFRLPYRNFGTYEVMVGNFAVDVGGDRAGIRWFELRKNPGGNWTLYQEGTHAPADNFHRWMGSIAMDKNGNLALGYSRSSTNTVPSIYIATRTPTDTLGVLQTEALFFAGSGAQTSSTRWGDYSALSVDPADDCTFWFTTEYYQTNSGNGWRTRLGAFRMPNCAATATYGVNLTPASAGQSGNPGQVLTYTLRVTNTGSASDTFTVTLSGNAFGTTAPSSVGALAAGASTTFNVLVAIPGGAAAGVTDTVNVNVTSQGDPTKQAVSALTTTVNAVRGVSLTPPTAAQNGNPGQVLTYTLRVTNTGNASDTFTVTLSGNAFGTTAPGSVGLLAAGASTTFNVLVTIPGGAAAGVTDTVNVNVTSQGDPTKQAVSALTTTVKAVRGVSLTPPTAAQSGNPGQVLTYTLRVTNTGNASDTFTVTLSGQAFSTTTSASVGPLVAGASATFNVLVTIPGGAAAGVTDTVQVNLTSQGDPTKQAQAALTTTTNAVHSLSVAAEPNALTGYVGRTVTYTVWVTNTGNGPDTYNITLVGTPVFTTTAPATVGLLAAGASITFNVVVTIPLTATVGATDLATYDLTSQIPGGLASVSLFTTAQRWHTYLPYVQR